MPDGGDERRSPNTTLSALSGVNCNLLDGLAYGSSALPLHGLEQEGVFARWNQGKSDGTAVASAVHVTCFQPRAQPRIEDVGMSVPELGRQAASNTQVVQLQINEWGSFGKIAPDVVDSNMQARNAATFTLRSNHHSVPASQCEFE